MTKIKLFVLCCFCFSIHGITGQVEKKISKKGIIVTFINEDKFLNDSIVHLYLGTFFEVYPKLTKTFNRMAIQQIKIKIDSSYNGVAYANDGQITISARWMKNNPYDADLMTHEAMHIIQQYPNGAAPGWLVEGIADFVRFKFGVNNNRANWVLPNWKEGNHYTNSYRVTAKFLCWLTSVYNKKLIVILDEQIRKKSYSDVFWYDYTKKSLDELWIQYVEYSKNK